MRNTYIGQEAQQFRQKAVVCRNYTSTRITGVVWFLWHRMLLRPRNGSYHLTGWLPSVLIQLPLKKRITTAIETILQNIFNTYLINSEDQLHPNARKSGGFCYSNQYNLYGHPFVIITELHSARSIYFLLFYKAQVCTMDFLGWPLVFPLHVTHQLLPPKRRFNENFLQRARELCDKDML